MDLYLYGIPNVAYVLWYNHVHYHMQESEQHSKEYVIFSKNHNI